MASSWRSGSPTASSPPITPQMRLSQLLARPAVGSGTRAYWIAVDGGAGGRIDTYTPYMSAALFEQGCALTTDGPASTSAQNSSEASDGLGLRIL